MPQRPVTNKKSSDKYYRLLKKRRRPPAYRRPLFWLTALLIGFSFFAGWWVWHGIYYTSHRFDYLLIEVDHEFQKIFSGETVRFHPKDRIRLVKVFTNIPFNYGVRLVCMNFDVNALQYEETPLFMLLPNQEIFDCYSFRIKVKYRNQDLGYMVWNIRPDPDDWLEKADTVGDEKRIAFLERAVDLFPEDIPLRRRIIREYISQKEWKKAARILEQEVEKDPDRDMLNELLMVYRKMSYNDGIVSTLRRLLQYDSEDVTYRLELAEALEEKGKWKRAIKEYEMVAGMVNGDDALNVYENLGYLYSKTGMIKKAISAYLKAIKMNPGDANLYYNLSYLYEKAGQTGKADWYLAKAANLKSSDLESRLKLSHRMIRKGQLMRAKRYLSDVLEKDPHSLEALILMSEILEKQHKKSELRKVYKKILAIEPMNDTVLYNLGVLEYEEGNLKAAMLHMGKYIKLHPEDVGAHEIMLDTFIRQDASEKAFEEAKILVRLAPKKMAPYHYIFDYLRLKGRYKEIISVMTKGLQANPKKVKLREYLVLSYLKTGQDSLAVKQIKEILKVRPKDVGLLFDLAVLYEKQGKSSLAMETYERILKIMPDNEKAEDAYLRLRLEGVQKGGVD